LTGAWANPHRNTTRPSNNSGGPTTTFITKARHHNIHDKGQQTRIVTQKESDECQSRLSAKLVLSWGLSGSLFNKHNFTCYLHKMQNSNKVGLPTNSHQSLSKATKHYCKTKYIIYKSDFR
jgi:hypothetical protein